MVHLQVEVSIREAVRILKQRYKTKKMSVALRQFMEDHDEKLMKTADAMAEMLGDNVDYDDDEDDSTDGKQARNVRNRESK